MSLLLSLVCAVCELGVTSRAFCHGFAGARFFPATLSTDDPFVSDELSLPTVSTIRTPDDGGTRETDISVDIAKCITPQFGIEIGETLTALNPHEGHAVNGFGNLEFAGKYRSLRTLRMKRLSPSDLVSKLAARARARLARTHSVHGRRGFFLVKVSVIYLSHCGF